MKICRTLAFLVGAFVAATGVAPVEARAATLSVVGSSTKICQLIGDTDWATGAPTAARTFTNYGLAGVDLGFPVDSAPVGPLYFLFGDTFPNGHPAGSVPTVPPDDALGITQRQAVPDSTTCLDLQLATSAPKTLAHPTVHPPIQQGSFNVPTGGIFVGETLYAFFWTEHCNSGNPLAPNAATPLALPPPDPSCPETATSNLVGRSVLAGASPSDPTNFYRRLPFPIPFELRFRGPPVFDFVMPSGFVYATGASPPEPVFRRPRRGFSIPVFGAARYRASIPYLALAPPETFNDPATWSFFAGTVGGRPQWVSRAQWESGRVDGQWSPPPGAEIYADENPGERCVGEHQVTWNAPLATWLLLYNCAGRIEARIAPEPWGPWSSPTVIISPTDPGVACTLLESSGCSVPPFGIGAGFFYAPFVLSRFTRDTTPEGAPEKQATIYWLVSTWDPYVVVVMRTTLALQP